jgi:hypothetical protein
VDAADKNFYGTTIFLTNGHWMIHSNKLADATDKHSFQAIGSVNTAE